MVLTPGIDGNQIEQDLEHMEFFFKPSVFSNAIFAVRNTLA